MSVVSTREKGGRRLLVRRAKRLLTRGRGRAHNGSRPASIASEIGVRSCSLVLEVGRCYACGAPGERADLLRWALEHRRLSVDTVRRRFQVSPRIAERLVGLLVELKVLEAEAEGISHRVVGAPDPAGSGRDGT